VIDEIIHYDNALLRSELDRLPPEHRAAFAAACAERLLPAYARFARESGRGEPETLRRALTRLWDDVTGNPMSELELRASVKKCSALVPGEGAGPGTEWEPSANDAAEALVYALESRYKHGSQEAAWSAGCANDALNRFVMFDESGSGVVVTANEEKLLRHPLVQAELARQRRDLDELLDARDVDVRQVAVRLRERAAVESAIFFGDVPHG